MTAPLDLAAIRKAPLSTVYGLRERARLIRALCDEIERLRALANQNGEGGYLGTINVLEQESAAMRPVVEAAVAYINVRTTLAKEILNGQQAGAIDEILSNAYCPLYEAVAAYRAAQEGK